MSVSRGALNKPVTIGLLLLLCMSCAESSYTESASALDGSLTSVTTDLSVDDPPPSIDQGNVPSIEDASTADLYIPPAPVDMAVLEPEEVEFTLRRCIQRMLDYLNDSWMGAGCEAYTMAQRSDPASGYTRDAIVASCMKLECTGQALEGHNGIPSTRSCRDLDDLVATLTLAGEDADAGTCGTPTFRLELIELDVFMGP